MMTIIQILDSLRLDQEHLLCQCQRQRFTVSGAGGQKRNRVRSAIRLVHPLGLCAVGSARRESKQNEKFALQALRCQIALSLIRVLPPKDLPQASHEDAILKLDEASKEAILAFCHDAQVNRIFRFPISKEHPDFASNLAVSILVLWRYEGNLALSATALASNSSKLAKFIKMENSLRHWLDDLRLKNGQGPIK